MISNLPKQPFNTLALSLSGGGYRAAAFHLGLLTYLDSINWNGGTLLERVRVISTVSGGTFTGVCYASSIAEKKPLSECYNRLYRFMSEVDLIEEGLHKLSSFDEWNSEKTRSLINAFSLVYLDKLEDKTFSHLFDNETHLKEIIFNATEFNYGLPFRFQMCATRQDQQNLTYLGNRQVNVPFQAMREVRLADIIAASSCFPMGFEPINFPGDFSHESSPVLSSLTESLGTDRWGNKCKFPIGLMDGGIVDNQGIDSVIWAEGRMKRYSGSLRNAVSADQKVIDLFIISDVASPFMDGYSRTEEKPLKKWRRWSFGKFRGVGFVSLVLAVLMLFLTFITDKTWISFIAGALTAVFSLICVLGFFLSRIFNKLIKAFDVPEFFASKLGRFSSMKFGIYETLINNRISSVISMVSEVFMKQIRRLSYGRVYNETGWPTRLIMNGIYELTPQHVVYHHKEKGDKLSKELKQVSSSLMTAATKAKSMGTTLWFTTDELFGEKENMLKTLIACGQFTACFNLLEYIEMLILSPEYRGDYNNYPDQLKTEIDELYNMMMGNWKAFNTDPYWMVEKIHPEMMK